MTVTNTNEPVSAIKHKDNMILNIDPHVHLGGCISTNFVWRVIQDLNLKHLAESYDDVYSQMVFSESEQRGFHRFLDKFKILDELPWNEALIDQSIASVCATLDAQNITYAWMDFSINKYMKIGWHKHQAIRFIYDSFNRHRPGGVGLILSIKYESMRASQKQYAQLIDHQDTAQCLIGIDLVGDETYFSSNFYKPLFESWTKAGKITRAHVGESQSAQNIFNSIIDLGVTNIAHGIKIVDDLNMMDAAKDRGITFDTSLTSNYLTGVWNDNTSHPILTMLRYGLLVTLGSDDPVQCNTTLAKEFERAKLLGATDQECDTMRKIVFANTKRMLEQQRLDVLF